LPGFPDGARAARALDRLVSHLTNEAWFGSENEQSVVDRLTG
jgi:hypothetical protein